jgi:hypothetical protein
MTDVLPILIVEPHQNLIVELVRRDVYGRHVWRKLEQQWNARHIQKAQA